MSFKKCKNDVDSFCYICGEFIKVRAKKFCLTSNIKLCDAYEAYFNLPVRSQDKIWAPHCSCNKCKNTLEVWYRGEKKSMKFAVPIIWREPGDHINDCYFCIVNPCNRRASKNSKKFQYPNLPSTSAPVPHSENFPVPSSPKLKAQEQPPPLSQISSNSEGSDFVIASPSVEPHLINSEEFNDLVKDLKLPKLKAEILASRLKQWNLLKNDVKIRDQRKRHEYKRNNKTIHF